MATFHEGKCRQCRREGEKLFLKGTRCFTEKCAFERRGYAPGEHGKDRRPKETNYGTQLRMKQKARRIYGVLERQFRNYFAPSRSSARRLVRHRHMLVNGKLVDIPSYQVRVGDEISVKAASKDLVAIQASVEHTKGRDMMSWLSLDPEKLSGRLLEYPTRGNIPTKVSEQLIVELYSK
jgi:small subunit ribosomal protein S4